MKSDLTARNTLKIYDSTMICATLGCTKMIKNICWLICATSAYTKSVIKNIRVKVCGGIFPTKTQPWFNATLALNECNLKSYDSRPNVSALLSSVFIRCDQ